MRFVTTLPTLLVLLAVTHDVAGSQPWWDRISRDFEGVNLHNCLKKKSPPKNGASCSKKPKTCYFGNKDCPESQGVMFFYPEIECFCNDRVWTCKKAECPPTITPPLAPPTAPPTVTTHAPVPPGKYKVVESNAPPTTPPIVPPIAPPTTPPTLWPTVTPHAPVPPGKYKVVESNAPSTTSPRPCECPKGYSATPDDKGCERLESVDAIFNGKLLTSCPGDDVPVYGRRGARFPGGLMVENGFFGQNNNQKDGRLNKIGLWACGQDLNGLAGTDPTNEWVGFSRCIEVSEDAEYVIGIAADNQARFRIDHAKDIPEFQLLGHGREPFEWWWMIPISLKAGFHIIELEGWNHRQAAAFGAEIYGPFETGATGSDAKLAALPYSSNIIWSTGPQIGGEFVSGTTSGYSCPDGTAIDTCETDVKCTTILREECLPPPPTTPPPIAPPKAPPTAPPIPGCKWCDPVGFDDNHNNG